MNKQANPLLTIITPEEFEWAHSPEAEHLWDVALEDRSGVLAPYHKIVQRIASRLQDALAPEFGDLTEEQVKMVGGVAYSSMLGVLKVIAVVAVHRRKEEDHPHRQQRIRRRP